MTTKSLRVCLTCGVTKPLEAFSSKVSRCRICRSAADKGRKRLVPWKTRPGRLQAKPTSLKPTTRALENYAPIPECGCWLWLGGWFGSGYGKMSAKCKTWQAHRVFYEHFVGPIPSGLLVCHKCDTPACVNPDHLFLGTAFDNMTDKARKGRGVKVGERKPPVILTDTQQHFAMSSRDPARVIADQLGVTAHRIRYIRRLARQQQANP